MSANFNELERGYESATLRAELNQQGRDDCRAEAIESRAAEIFEREVCDPIPWKLMSEAMGEIDAITGAAIAEAFGRSDYIAAGAKIDAAVRTYWQDWCAAKASEEIDAEAQEARDDATADRFYGRAAEIGDKWRFWNAPPVDGRGCFLAQINIRADIFTNEEHGLVSDAGCLDAPTDMPAGSCRCDPYGQSDVAFARQMRFRRES